MQFDYQEEGHKGKPIAVITPYGNLMFAPKDSPKKCTTICQNGKTHMTGNWFPEEALKKFYKGDSVTITF